MSQTLVQLSGYALAFLLAMVVIAVDCDSALKKTLPAVQIGVLHSSRLWVLAIGCGLVSAVCFYFSYQAAVTGIVELKWTNPPVRGIFVGLAVLTILRSKLLNFKDTEVGGEFFYNSGRAWVISALYQKWIRFKDGSTTPEIVAAACKSPGFEADLVDEVYELIAPRPATFQASVRTQITELQTTRPSTALDCADRKWLFYTRALIKLALDSAGAGILSRPCFSSVFNDSSRPEL